MNLSPADGGANGNSSNPRPGQNPFPQSMGVVRQASTRDTRPYQSTYSNNFDRANARFSTGRAEATSRDTASSAYPMPLRLTAPRPRQTKLESNESIYGMYGDVKTPKEAAPPRRNQSQRRPAQPPAAEDEDSADEEVPRQPDPEPQRRFRRQQSSATSGQRRNNNSRRDQRSDEQNETRNNQQSRQRRDDNTSRGYERVNINIDTGTGTTRSWSRDTRDTETDSQARTNIHFGGTPFGDSGFPFGGRNNNGGGRLPVNMPFNLPINLPFGL